MGLMKFKKKHLTFLQIGCPFKVLVYDKILKIASRPRTRKDQK